jgi:membrane associated rhomboid family serine protease
MFFLPLRGASPKTRIAFVNYFIIAANILIFFYTFPFSLSLSDVGQFVALLKTYGIVPGNLKFHMLITSAFLHANIFHVGFNMLFLWVFGGNIEDNLGHISYLFFYVIAGIVASLPHVILNPNSSTPMIGASGAISGVLGAYAVLYPGSRVTTLFIPFYFIIAVRIVSIRALWFLCFWFALQILGGLVGLFGPQSEGGVAYSAHIAGFLFGLAIALIGVATHFLKREKRYKYDI